MADDELLDVLDDLGRRIGVADRGTVHAEGLWHRVAHILVVARRGGRPTAVLQRRATGKATFPGLLDLSATGHLAAGETPRDGVRELREELGITVGPEQLLALGVRRVVDETPEGPNRELAHVFLVRDDRPLGDYAPDPIEVDAVVDLPLAAGLELLAGERDAVECVASEADGDAVTRLSITRDAFVPDPPVAGVLDGIPPGYWTTLLVMAQRFAEGKGPVAI